MSLSWSAKVKHRDWENITKALILRCDPETYQEVSDYARTNQISRAEAVRTFVEWGLEINRGIAR